VTTETWLLRDGRTMPAPEHADVDVMLEWLAGDRDFESVVGEAVLFWAEVQPREDDGALLHELVLKCRSLVDPKGQE
jgi:hypothetical protein